MKIHINKIFSIVMIIRLILFGIQYFYQIGSIEYKHFITSFSILLVPAYILIIVYFITLSTEKKSKASAITYIVVIMNICLLFIIEVVALFLN